MEEELQVEQVSELQTETISSVKTEEEKQLDSLPRLEDMLKSEKEIKIKNEIEGVTQVEQSVAKEDRVFKKKSEEKKVYVKRRLKIVTGVYAAVLTLLLAFTGFNVATMAMLNKDITTNANTIQTEQVRVEVLEQTQPSAVPGAEFTVDLNEPRDYSDDTQELTFLDKITILFRNIFG